MTNDAAERLLNDLARLWTGIPYIGERQEGLALVNAALAAAWQEGFTASAENQKRELIEAHDAGRRATVERIRAEADRTWMLPARRRLYAILDAEAKR
jgi:hypothetical protein